MRIWIVMVVATLAIALVLGVALPGLAASDEAAPKTGDCWPRLLRGEVTGIDDEGDPKSFDIQAGKQAFTIVVDENTRYFILQPPQRLLNIAQQRIVLGQQDREGPRAVVPAEPGQLMAPERAQQIKRLIWAKRQWFRPFGEGAGFSDIAVGDRVAVLLVPESERYLARVVTIMKPATYGRVSGTVTDVSEDSITIEPASGDEVTLEYNENTLFILKGIIMIDPEAEPFARAVYNTETTLAEVVRVWPEAPQLPEPSD